MDPQIEELKELMRRNIAVSEDTNRLVHSMHRSAIWSTFFHAIWWLTIVGVTGAAYYYFIAPYVGDIMGFYGKAQQVIQGASTSSPFHQ